MRINHRYFNNFAASVARGFVYHRDCEKKAAEKPVGGGSKEKREKTPTPEQLSGRKEAAKKTHRKAREKMSADAAENYESANKPEIYFSPEGKTLKVERLRQNAELINEGTLIALEKLNPGLIKTHFCQKTIVNGAEVYKFLHDHQGRPINNKRLDDRVGLAEIFVHEPGVRGVEVLTGGGVSSRLGKRQEHAYAGSFFDEKGRYVAVRRPALFRAVQSETPAVTADREKKYKEAVREQTDALLHKAPEAVKKAWEAAGANQKTLRSAVKEIVRNGGDARLAVLSLASRRPEALAGNLNAVDLRWEIRVARLLARYQAVSGQKGRDAHGNYTAPFLAFYSELESPPAGFTKESLLQAYAALCGRELAGTAAEIEAARKLARGLITARGRNSWRGEYVLERLFYREPKLRAVWDELTGFLGKNKIPVAEESAQNGLTLFTYQHNLLAKLRANPQAVKILTLLRDKDSSWKLDIGTLPNLFAYLATPARAYRNETFAQLEAAKDAGSILEILRAAPRPQVQIEFPPGTGLGLKSCYGVRPPIPSMGIMSANMHAAVDISNGPNPNFALRAPNVPSQVIGFYDGDEYVYAADGTRKTWTVAGRTRYRTKTCWITLRYFDASLGKHVQFSYAHLKAGSVRDQGLRVGQVLRPGQVIGVAGNTGRSTTDHLHLGVRIDGETADPLPFLPPEMQLKVIRWRRAHPDYALDFARYKRPHYQSPQTEEVARRLRAEGVVI